MANIRAAEPGDLTAVAEIYAHYVAHSVATFELELPTESTWRARLNWCVRRGMPFLVTGDREIVGYAYCAPWKERPAYDRTVEDSIYLAPWATGRGIGGTLLAELVRRAGCGGAREMLAVIADSGEDASLALHKRCGFTEAGRLTGVGHKHDRWLDTVLLQRSLRR